MPSPSPASVSIEAIFRLLLQSLKLNLTIAASSPFPVDLLHFNQFVDRIHDENASTSSALWNLGEEDQSIPDNWKSICKEDRVQCLLIIHEMVESDKWKTYFPNVKPMTSTRAKELCGAIVSDPEYLEVCQDNIIKANLYKDLYVAASPPPLFDERGAKVSGLSGWKVATFVVGTAIGLLLFGVLIYWCIFSKPSGRQSGKKSMRTGGKSSKKSAKGKSGVKSGGGGKSKSSKR